MKEEEEETGSPCQRLDVEHRRPTRHAHKDPYVLAYLSWRFYIWSDNAGTSGTGSVHCLPVRWPTLTKCCQSHPCNCYGTCHKNLSPIPWIFPKGLAATEISDDILWHVMPQRPCLLVKQKFQRSGSKSHGGRHVVLRKQNNCDALHACLILLKQKIIIIIIITLI